MKISALKTRQKFWAKHFHKECLGDSDPTPYTALANWQDLFTGADVLEIGPGEGRQFDVVMPLAASYAVADINPVVLRQDLYADCERILLKSYTIAERESWDVAMAWYVLHHVTKAEGAAFIQMLADSVRPGGKVLLNAPDDALPAKFQPQKKRGAGTLTTGWKTAEVIQLFNNAGLSVVRAIHAAINSVVYLAEKP
jgi:2-polyprenyl-3-methyl-5-hydroxy-6-metoxy-1,4-benzoquinol methylase